MSSNVRLSCAMLRVTIEAWLAVSLIESFQCSKGDFWLMKMAMGCGAYI